MKKLNFKDVAKFTTVLACILSAAWLGYSEVGHWGWFLLVGFLLGISD